MEAKWHHREIPTSEGGPSRNLQNFCDSFPGLFPKGLRVFVFDEDPAYLQELEKDLLGFQYQVSICNEEEQAMYLLRNHRNSYDIAIIEGQNSKGDIFRLISEIGSEMDLPIIIISKDESVESVSNWMVNGACDYLIKPIKPEDLRMIFKHVAKKRQGRRSVAAGEAEEKAAGAVEKSSSVGDSTMKNPNKRKRGIDEENHVHDRDYDRTSTSKKRRVVWDEELHKKFLAAVEELGPANAVPKKILEVMNDPRISRENVASHLQKFRIGQKKHNEHKEREMNLSLTTPQERRMYGGEEATDLYKGGDVQLPTYHINNILQPCVQQQHMTNTNLTTQLVSPFGHHHIGDGVSVVVSGRNMVMTHHHSIENTEKSLDYNNFQMHSEDEAVVANLTCLFTQNSQESGMFQFHEPVMGTATMIPNNHHSSASLEGNQQQMMINEPPMMHLPSFSSSYTHSSFFDQMADEGEVFNFNSSVDNNKHT